MTQETNLQYKEPEILDAVPKRVFSLDALRGFSMFWIMGADTLIHLLAPITGSTVLMVLSAQLKHAPWAGFNAYDLIFPLFMFLSGTALGLSLAANPARADDKTAFLRKAGKRTLVLIALGILYNFGWDFSPERFRVASVLGQIGIAYFATAILFTYAPSWSIRITSLLLLLLGITCLQLFVPVPGIGPGILTPEGSINGWIDRSFLPGRLYGVTYDPEGLLNTVSAASVTILGGLFGSLLAASGGLTSLKKLMIIALSGITLVSLGYALDSSYPIIKAAWTVPFSLVSGGYSALLLTLFYVIFDQLKYRKAGFFFSVIGMNSIGIYMAARFFAYPFFGLTGGKGALPPLASVALVTALILLEWLALYFCYKKRWFLKV